MNNVTTQILMSLIDGYAESRHVSGHHTYNERTALARECCKNAIEQLVKAAGTPSVFTGKERPHALISLPVIDPSLLEVGK